MGAQCGLSGSGYRFRIPLYENFRQQHPNGALYVHGISPFPGGHHALLPNSGAVYVPPVIHDDELAHGHVND